MVKNLARVSEFRSLLSIQTQKSYSHFQTTTEVFPATRCSRLKLIDWRFQMKLLTMIDPLNSSLTCILRLFEVMQKNISSFIQMVIRCKRPIMQQSQGNVEEDFSFFKIKKIFHLFCSELNFNPWPKPIARSFGHNWFDKIWFFDIKKFFSEIMKIFINETFCWAFLVIDKI